MPFRQLSTILGVTVLLASLVNGVCLAGAPSTRVSGGFDALWLNMNQKLQQVDLGTANVGRYLIENDDVDYKLFVASARANVRFVGGDIAVKPPKGNLTVTAKYDWLTQSGDGDAGRARWTEMTKMLDGGRSFNFGYAEVDGPEGWDDVDQLIKFDIADRNGSFLTMFAQFRSNRKARRNDIVVGGMYLLAADPVLLGSGGYLESLVASQLSLELERLIEIEVARRGGQEPPQR